MLIRTKVVIPLTTENAAFISDCFRVYSFFQEEYIYLPGTLEWDPKMVQISMPYIQTVHRFQYRKIFEKQEFNDEINPMLK